MDDFEREYLEALEDEEYWHYRDETDRLTDSDLEDMAEREYERRLERWSERGY